MKFEEAVECLKRGERIKRSYWRSCYLKMEGEKVKMSMGFRKPWHYSFRNQDITANDWLIDTNHKYYED